MAGFPHPPTSPVTRQVERNPARSREAILDAAESLFARQGYERTSLGEVGQVAGLSRATPGYFFGSKADLYRAVIDRSFGEAREAVLAGRARAVSSGERPERILAGVVSDYYDFLSARPAFVRLMEREALGDGPETGANPALAAGQEALAAMVAELGLDDGRSREAAHLLLSLVALCWFPLVHGRTLLPGVGLDPGQAGYDDERKRHLIDLILHGVSDRLSRADPAGASPSGRSSRTTDRSAPR